MELKCEIVAQKIPMVLLQMPQTSQTEFDNHECLLLCDYEVQIRRDVITLDESSILLFDEHGNRIEIELLKKNSQTDFINLINLINLDIENRAHEIVESYYQSRELDKAEPENHREF